MRQKRLLKKFFEIFSTVLFFIGIAGIIFYLLSFFKVKQMIVVNPASTNKTNSQINGLNLFKNKIIFFLNEKNVSESLIKRNPQLKNIKMTKNYPNTIIIYPTFLTIIAQLKTTDGFFLLTNNGRVIKKTKIKMENLTLINFYQAVNFYSYQSGDYIQYKEILISLKFLEKLKKLGLNNINTVDIKSFDVIVFNKEGKTEILISTQKNEEQLLYELESLVKKNKIMGRKIKKIDLRFNKPVITLYE